MDDIECLQKHGKFFNLIKKKVKFDENKCGGKCEFLDTEWFTCNLFTKSVHPVFIRCRQCKTYFGK